MKKIDQQPKNLWPGLASYRELGYQFCGRTSAVGELVKLIDNNLFVTLYGRTGVGKTSLLNAGVFPILRTKNYVPIAIRPGMDARGTSIAATIVEKIREQLIEVRHEAVRGETYDPNSMDYLWRYFCTTRFKDRNGLEVYPVVVLDQLEEVLITRGDDARFLLQQIYCLLDDGRVVPNTLGYNDDTNFRFVISLREDNLFYLEDSIDHCFLTEMKQNRYRLTSLTHDDARDVILKPGRDIFMPEEREQISNKLIELSIGMNGEISSLILSLICSQLYDRIILHEKAQQITLKDVEQTSGIFLEEFYDNVTAHLPGAQRKFIEDRLVSDDGRRESVSEQTFKKHVPNGDFLLDDETRLLQRTPTSSGQQRIELVHDIIALVIFKRRIERNKTVNVMQNLVLVGLFDLIMMFCCSFWTMYYATVQHSNELTLCSLIVLTSIYMTNLCRNVRSKKMEVPFMFFVGFAAILSLFYFYSKPMSYGSLSIKMINFIFYAFVVMAIIDGLRTLHMSFSFGYMLNNNYTWKQLILLQLKPRDKRKSYIQLGAVIMGIVGALILNLSSDSVQNMRTKAQKDDPQAICDLGDYYVKYGGSTVRARSLFDKAAALGSEEADEKLKALDSGLTIEIDDNMQREALVAFLEDSISISESLKLVEELRDSMTSNREWLQYIYNYYNYWGQSHWWQHDIALKWLSLAARSNQPWAKRILGIKMLRGDGVQQDTILAFELFYEASNMGDYAAMRLLVAAYYYGWGTKRNVEAARQWAKKLVDAGQERANLLIKLLAL